MAKLNVYLNFEDKCEEAFNFYRAVFGGEFKTVMRFKDMPMPGGKTDPRDQDKIMHIALPIGKDDILMGSDTPRSMKIVHGNNVRISLTPETKEEASRLFSELSVGGKIEMPMADMPWGDYYGDFRDRYGVYWMVDYAYPKAEVKPEPMSIAPSMM